MGWQWREGSNPSDNLYCGTAGVLLSCAEVAGCGQQLLGPAGSAVAEAALARLHYLVESPDAADDVDAGLFSGWAGIVVALRAWAVASANGEAEAAARVAADRLADQVVAERYGDPCADIISGDAGTLLALLPVNSDRCQAAAEALVGRLIAAAEPTEFGPQWRMRPGYPSLMPGFSHGTAGVAYALAVAGVALDCAPAAELARRGADTLIALGRRSEGWAVPLQLPPKPDRPPVFYGWCHGPAGTGRLFAQLEATDGGEKWTGVIHECLGALERSGLPERRYPGFWDNVARCCGTAGLGSFLLDRCEVTGERRLLDWSQSLAVDVLNGTNARGVGASWSNIEYTAVNPLLAPEPGFMQGATGIAGWLARLHTFRCGERPVPVRLGVDPRWV
ncbi:MAG: hypothetical protein JO147_01545 [Actinobacteria bacterium]|nr:hypothetical protein [Actinomycetota bacterium]